jgi:phage tail sheath protein FI
MAAIPGVTDQSVQNALISLAESTQNFLAVVSPPVGFQNSQQAIAWTNGKATGRTASINSSYAAVYWPWVKSFDAFTGKDRFYDPSIYAIGQMCFTDEVADPWFAPAGLTRGRLTKPTDVEVKLNQGDRDALYGPGNIVNPITKFTTDGIVIYGQKTGQRAATALDRINVRRLMIFLRRLVLQSARRFVFEPNDPITWEAVRNVISPALADIQQRRGLVSFKVVCDSSTNTPLRVDRNELWCKIILKPTKTAEVLVFELNLTNQGASV